ncbi:PH domain-containing protein [Spirillospora sp. NPDC029432]|uniref:PH domain-containing protein n=1 Tax=Spirillospora sp. NPDC029432 TaxID=3154599 RepID=UPI003453A8A0
MTDVPALPAVWRPRTTRVVAYATAGTIMVAMIVLAIVVAPPFGLSDRILMVVFGAFLAWILHMLARCRVTADDGGVTVVNAFRTRRLEWAEILDVNMNVGEPWPTLDLADGTSLGAMGINGTERRLAARQLDELRTLVTERGEAPDPS